MAKKLELKLLTKTYGERAVVDRLSLAVGEGQFVSLLGPSGCGKSTTLAMVAGFVEPDGGDILVNGQSILDTPPRHRRIGLVFQDYALFSRLSVRANMGFGLEALGLRRLERDRRVEGLAEKFGLVHLLDRSAGALNMSEMQRVALARVLVTEPQLLLLDEPMSNLDAAIRQSLRTELKQIQKAQNQSVLYVTHDQVEAMSMSDLIAVMNEGSVQQIGSPQNIYNHPENRFVAEFIGDPPINVIPCTVKTSGREAWAVAAHGESVPLGSIKIDGGAHALAVRPHDIMIDRKPPRGTSRLAVRFLENLGSEHVLHLDYGEQMLAVAVHPGTARVGDQVGIGLNAAKVHLVNEKTGLVVPRADRSTTP
jgi:multiple sugar transport system ATP-binding protein